MLAKGQADVGSELLQWGPTKITSQARGRQAMLIVPPIHTLECQGELKEPRMDQRMHDNLSNKTSRDVGCLAYEL